MNADQKNKNLTADEHGSTLMNQLIAREQEQFRKILCGKFLFGNRKIEQSWFFLDSRVLAARG